MSPRQPGQMAPRTNRSRRRTLLPRQSLVAPVWARYHGARPERDRPRGCMYSIFKVIMAVLQLLSFAVIIVAIMSWLLAFNVINIYNKAVRTIWDTLNALIDPLLRPIRRVVPIVGGLDLSPLILLLLIYFIESLINEYVFVPRAFG